MTELCKLCKGRPEGYRCGMCGGRPISAPENELCRLCGGHPIDYNCGLCGKSPETRPSAHSCGFCQDRPIGHRCGYCGAIPIGAAQTTLCQLCGNNPPNHGCESCGARPKTLRPDGVFWVCKHGVFDRHRRCVQCGPEVGKKAEVSLKPSEACKSCLRTPKGYCCVLCGERSGSTEHTNTSSP
ncbi:uncharacterized protein BKA55DRAFT_578317 [Fusarium redolens]|uniref:Uncharacterized protein n=1 Tax=Fusarium redolens TaxID=48865 RepID=A0A9P9GFX8_FUSRE|nr:uncharacterized protein BKA55DRAFT_578317 [Fusarium redolens]KAH7237797.1 hypothetical protein BKA55DRAFT_578317 [Fusarium redolens]